LDKALPSLHARGPVGSFWSKDVLKLIENFRNLTTCSPGKNCSISYFLDSSPSRVFNLPLSIAAEQLEELQTLIEESNWGENTEDTWKYKWGIRFILI